MSETEEDDEMVYFFHAASSDYITLLVRESELTVAWAAVVAQAPRAWISIEPVMKIAKGEEL